MKNLLTKLLLLAANLYCYALCWGVYWLCFACWWLVVKGTPAARRWARDKALPWVGQVLLALALDAVAFVVWLAWLIHDPKAAVRQTRERLIGAVASVAAWLMSLAYRAMAGASYSGKCRRPVLCPVVIGGGTGLERIPERTVFAEDLLSAAEPAPPFAAPPATGSEPAAIVEAVASAPDKNHPADPVEPAPAAEHRLPLLACDPAVPVAPLLTFDPFVPGGATGPVEVSEPNPSDDPTPGTKPPPEVAQPPLAEFQQTTTNGDDLVTQALALIGGGMSRRAVAKALGVAESTLRARLKKSASVPAAA